MTNLTPLLLAIILTMILMVKKYQTVVIIYEKSNTQLHKP